MCREFLNVPVYVAQAICRIVSVSPYVCITFIAGSTLSLTPHSLTSEELSDTLWSVNCIAINKVLQPSPRDSSLARED